MLMRVIIGRLKCSVIASNQFIKSIRKINSFSNVKYLKSYHKVALRTYVSAIPETNTSPELERNRELFTDGYYYYHYISSNPQFSELIFRKEVIPENANTSSLLFTTLREFSSKAEIVGEDLERLIPHLETELQNLSFNELLQAMNFTFTLYELDHENHIWDLVRKCFDVEFLRRSLSNNEKFIILNGLNSYGIFKKFKFSFKTIDKFCFNVGKLTHPQFIHFCYYLRKRNQITLSNFKFEFMNSLKERIPSLNQSELGLLAYTLTQINLTLRFMFETFMMRVLSDIENMDVIPLKSICKNLSLTKPIKNLQLLIDFQEKLIPLVPKFKNHQLLNLVFSGLCAQYKNMVLYDEVMKRVKSDIANFDLMDISRYVYFSTMFNIDDKEFIDMALNEFERRDDHLMKYVAYTKFLADLVHFQIYPKNLLEKVLSNDVLMKILKGKSGVLSWATLKWSLSIEKPDLILPEVNEKLNTKLLKYVKHIQFRKKPEFYYHKRIMQVLESIYSENTVCSRRISYHHTNCCIMRFDKNLQAQTIPVEFKESKNDFRMRPLCDDHIWVCILPLHKGCYADWNEKIINYQTQTRVRQLSILGYKHIYIEGELYTHLSKDPSNQPFWKSLINEKLQKLTGEILQTKCET